MEYAKALVLKSGVYDGVKCKKGDIVDGLKKPTVLHGSETCATRKPILKFLGDSDLTKPKIEKKKTEEVKMPSPKRKAVESSPSKRS